MDKRGSQQGLSVKLVFVARRTNFWSEIRRFCSFVQKMQMSASLYIVASKSLSQLPHCKNTGVYKSLSLQNKCDEYCRNNGTCRHNQDGTQTCVCAPPYSGPTCETNDCHNRCDQGVSFVAVEKKEFSRHPVLFYGLWCCGSGLFSASL